MITGYNTDIEHGGIVYHVQTEDKGLDTPMILSLVYDGGRILASKRTPYDDLLVAGFDEKILAERLSRQHKLICAAISAGRIDDLQRMTYRDSEGNRVKPPLAVAVQEVSTTDDSTSGLPHVKGSTARLRMPGMADFARIETSEDVLQLSLVEEPEFHGGARVILRIRVTRGTAPNVAGAPVVVKVLGSAFRPLSFNSVTGADGIATITLEIPRFSVGRAALLITTTVGGYEAELRRIINAN